MKSWFTSKTVIVNVLTLIAGVLTVAMGSDLVKEYPKVAAALATAMAAVNIALRFITKLPIGPRTINLPHTKG